MSEVPLYGHGNLGDRVGRLSSDAPDHVPRRRVMRFFFFIILYYDAGHKKALEP